MHDLESLHRTQLSALNSRFINDSLSIDFKHTLELDKLNTMFDTLQQQNVRLREIFVQMEELTIATLANNEYLIREISKRPKPKAMTVIIDSASVYQSYLQEQVRKMNDKKREHDIKHKDAKNPWE